MSNLRTIFMRIFLFGCINLFMKAPKVAQPPTNIYLLPFLCAFEVHTYGQFGNRSIVASVTVPMFEARVCSPFY